MERVLASGWILAPLILGCASSLAVFGAEKPQFPEKALLAPARPAASALKDEQGAFFTSFSAVVWQGKIWGLEFAEKSYIPTNLTTSSATFKEKLYIPDFAWKLGGKLDIGYQLPHDGWDLNSRYTYYSDCFTSKKKHFNTAIAPPGIGIVPLWYYPFFPTSTGDEGVPVRYGSATANWKLYFNSVDLELGRASFAIPSLPVRIAIGLKGAWIHQHYHANYENGTTVSITPVDGEIDFTSQLINSRFSYGQHSWGLGPRLCFNSNWALGYGFSLIANGSFSLLYSTHKTTTEFNDTVFLTGISLISGGVQTPSLHRKESFHELDPVLESQLGFDWAIAYGKQNPFAFGISIAYEWQYWWSQNHARRGYAPSSPGTTFDSRGDLQMHGLTTTLHFDF